MRGVFFIAANTAISYGYSGKQLSERHHWLFSAKFIGSALAFHVQATLELFVGIEYVILLGIILFMLNFVIVVVFLPNTDSHIKKESYIMMLKMMK